ncbi:D-alanine--poly(phosphoribitol) ligase subunit 2 [Oenococcus oeni]|uniref:D-alanine--poly(phosphoribitol) ligase subunit DltC n=1 Tax=Oenococcus oeni TaxID=1247 RepID=UPI00107A0C8B|nr:D-alanine--poly(phosphoribitol) ligase subunit DltC [Oenococcus oeni]AVI93583.1 D-alanine--poly(phosphoribitol) ligase subunit 2 [Oenococcus oeni]SYW00949.1 D-alanine--poly(phosphoribitol) ligase subunit 2 [Oenococcus oeni]SYW02425.1 D-alanine--poly(phosphoribitol) ligase subunit 2 [Oenococcus oeni]SYW13893.1 D-alanine--poly(phosphoribitol) ligase subunit 2 [Oenococcus oeni]SYW18513.1 D-alanine--poly(phosphoribitol) ligase subunit 2 [Oenococcus oeni]
MEKEVLAILENISGEDLSNQMDDNYFDNGLMDSMATVDLVLALQDKFGINVPVSEFDRSKWDTPNKVIKRVKELADN